MKQFSLTIEWDNSCEGAFPTKEIEALGMTVSVQRVTHFEDTITITSSIADDLDQCQIAYKIGRIVALAVSKYIDWIRP